MGFLVPQIKEKIAKVSVRSQPTRTSWSRQWHSSYRRSSRTSRQVEQTVAFLVPQIIRKVKFCRSF